MITPAKSSSRLRVRTPRDQLNSSTQSHQPNEDHFFMSFGIRKRRIFYNTRYSEEEKKWVREIRHVLKHQKNIQIHEKQILLRYFYSSNLKMDECINKLERYWVWFNDPDIQNLSKEGRQLLRTGFVYSYGANKQNHPFSVMNLGNMQFQKYPLKIFFQALNHVNNRVIRQGFTPGHIETYDYILDLQQKFLSLPITSLNEYIQTISTVYSMRMNKMYIINCTAFAKWIYTGVEKVLSEETAKKIKLFTKEEIDNGSLLEFIDEHVLEEKYGGKRKNFDHEQEYLEWEEDQRRLNTDMSQTQYFSIEQNNEMFQGEDKDASRQVCCSPEECLIY